MNNVNPCYPSPCGPNAICRDRNGVGSCSCLPDYFGNPYEGCKPECVRSTDCPSQKECIRNKCIDPCPGICGQNTVCYVTNHIPSCSCIPDYSGNPYKYCIPIPSKIYLTHMNNYHKFICYRGYNTSSN